MKTSLVKTLLSVLIVFSLSEVNALNFNQIKKDTVNCLKIVGVIPCEYEDAPALVELISYNQRIDTAILAEGATKFKFLLKKNTSYTIRISRQGFVPRLIVIDTRIPQEVDEMFKFTFTTKLMKAETASRLNQDALDFPVAMIYFDMDQQSFDYDKQYTIAVKSDWYKTGSTNDITMKDINK